MQLLEMYRKSDTEYAVPQKVNIVLCLSVKIKKIGHLTCRICKEKMDAKSTTSKVRNAHYTTQANVSSFVAHTSINPSQ